MPAVVAAGRIRLHLPLSHSLKDKRQIVRSLQARIRENFGVSIAETGDHDLWQVAELTVAIAASDARHARATLDKIAEFIDDFHLPVQIASAESDYITF
jgi:uncharacterized protein YlxP (DUF503 family)